MWKSRQVMTFNFSGFECILGDLLVTKILQVLTCFFWKIQIDLPELAMATESPHSCMLFHFVPGCFQLQTSTDEVYPEQLTLSFCSLGIYGHH